MGRSGLPDAPFPGWTRIEAELKACARSGDDAKLSAVEVMVVLGEVDHLHERIATATRLLRTVAAGYDCWGSDQGYVPCAFRSVNGFLAGDSPRRRWWRRV